MLPSCDVYLATYKNKLNASDCIYAILIPCNFLSETFFRILCSYTNNRVYIPKTDILYVFINSSLNRVGHAQQNTITMKWPESKAAIKQKKNSHKTSVHLFCNTLYTHAYSLLVDAHDRRIKRRQRRTRVFGRLNFGFRVTR